MDPGIMSLDGRHLCKLKQRSKKMEISRHSAKIQCLRSHVFSRRSQGLSLTPRPPNLTNAEIYSLQSPRNPTPKGSSFNHTDSCSMMAAGRNSNFGASDVYGLSASRGPTPRPSNYEEESGISNKTRFHCHNQGGATHYYPTLNPGMFSPMGSRGTTVTVNTSAKKPNGAQAHLKPEDGGKDLRMFLWNSSASPVSDVFGNHEYDGHH